MTIGKELPVFTYDQVPYSGAVEAEAHPRYLEAIAMLQGMRPAVLDACRVLELGCAGGRTLLHLAEEFPDSRFTGIDLAADRIDEANAIATEVGLTNVEFRHVSLTEVDESWGTFDYILCCGVLSWVPQDVQGHIFRVIKANLASQGVAVVTYKTFPGWHHLNIVRDALRYHTDDAAQPLERIRNARKILEFLAGETSTASVQGRIYRDDSEFLRGAQDDYLFHDYLTDDSYPLYFHEFHRRAAEHELQYLGETNFARNSLPPDASAARAAMTDLALVERCQMLDFLNNAAYRKSLLCRGDVKLTPSIVPRKMRPLQISLREVPTPTSFDIASTEVLSFKYESGSLNIAAPFGKAALRYLIDTVPRPISLSELCEGANKLLPPAVHSMRAEGEHGENLLAAAMLGSLEAGLIQVCVRPPDFVQQISDMPAASPLARALAQRSEIIANRCHQNVRLSKDTLMVLSQLDGETGNDDLIQKLAASQSSDPTQQLQSPRQRLDNALAELSERVFLVR